MFAKETTLHNVLRANFKRCGAGMIRVLFVCLGNICRSPMAEAIFRNLVMRQGLSDRFDIDSAGTGEWHVGESAHPGTLKILTENGIKHTGKARLIQVADLDSFDYILTMDDHNLRDVKEIGTGRAKISPLLAYAPEIGTNQVPDPYYNGRYQRVYDLCTVACDNLLQSIRSEHNL